MLLTQDSLVRLEIPRAEADEHDLFNQLVGLQEAARLCDCDSRRRLERKAVGARADRGKRNTSYLILRRKPEAIAIAVGQELVLTFATAAPAWTDGVHDPLRRQPVPLGELRFAGRAPAEGAALGEQIGPRSSMDRAIDASAAEERRISGVDDGVDVLACDVALDYVNSVIHR